MFLLVSYRHFLSEVMTIFYKTPILFHNILWIAKALKSVMMIYFQISMRSSRYAPQSLQRAVRMHELGKAVVPRTNAYSLSS